MKSQIATYIHATGNAWPEICRIDGCLLCDGADRPPAGRGNTSLSLMLADIHLLIDTGAGCHAGVRRARLAPPDAVFVTHSHPDHLNEMELNTVLRDIHLSGKPKPFLISTEHTWQDIREFHQKQLEFVPVEVGKEFVLKIGQKQFCITAIDASDHWRGAVNFIISADGFRFGALFDRKTWSAVGSVAENLDLAVIEANSIYPMSDKTGHTSLAEALEFLRTLSAPPRLSLFTHMGHDDSEQLSMGSLAGLLHGLAPNKAVGWAYPGMMISAAQLPPRNPVAVLDARTNIVVGVGEKSAVHAAGCLHGSVLILLRTFDGQIALYRRHAEQSYPLCLDVFGGHYAPADAPDPRNTALREASEEIKLAKDGFSVPCDSSWLRLLSKPFELESHGANNRERSTLFGIQLPAGVSVEAAGDDTDAGRRVCGKLEVMTLREFLALHATMPNNMADGLTRVISAFRNSEGIRQRMDSFLNGEKHETAA